MWQPQGHRRKPHLAYRFEVITALSDWDAWPEILDGMSLARAASGHSLVLRPLSSLAQRASVVRDGRLLGETDGLAVIGLQITAELLDWLNALDVPVVLADVEHPAFTSVAIDHNATAAIAVRHLLQLGHQRIALVEEREVPPALELTAEARRCAYRAALAEAGIDVHVGYEATANADQAAATQLINQWRLAAEPPTAIVCGSDKLAMTVWRAAAESGLRVPEDLSVVGYGDSPCAEYVGLTAVRLPLKMLGQRVVRLLFDRVHESSCEPIRMRLAGELVTRRTSGPPPTGRGLRSRHPVCRYSGTVAEARAAG